MNRLLFLLLILIITGLSCKTSKHTSTPRKNASASFVNKKMNKNSYDFAWFSSKIKFDLGDSGPIKNLSAAVRIRKDSVIWISLSAILGIEVGRILITRDSVKILNRLKKEYLVKPIQYIQSKVPVQVDFPMLQKIILGQLIYYDKKSISVNIENNYYLLTSKTAQTKNTLWITPKDFTIYKMLIEPVTNEPGLTTIFTNYEKVDQRIFSLEREMEFKGQKDLSVSMKYSHVKFDDPQKFPFQIPESYETIH